MVDPKQLLAPMRGLRCRCNIAPQPVDGVVSIGKWKHRQEGHRVGIDGNLIIRERLRCRAPLWRELRAVRSNGAEFAEISEVALRPRATDPTRPGLQATLRARWNRNVKISWQDLSSPLL